MYGTTAAIFSLLLVLTGMAKLRSPMDVARAVGAVGLPSSRLVGFSIGAAEIVVGVAALITAQGLAIQSLLYLAFAGWILLALRREVPLASCGCLGKDDTPPTIGHLTMNVVAALASAAASIAGPIQVAPGLGGVAQFALVAVGVFLAYVILTDGARLVGVRSR